MTKSRQELIDRALEELGVISAGQTASAEDVAVIENEIDVVMSDLSTRDVYQWGDPDEFDNDAFIHLALILANSKARPFGVPYDDNLRLRCEARLRQLQPILLSGQPQSVDYY